MKRDNLGLTHFDGCSCPECREQNLPRAGVTTGVHPGRRVYPLVALLLIALLSICACRLADEIAWTKNVSPIPTASTPMMGAAQVMPVPFPVTQTKFDWIGFAGIIAVQVLTWWLGKRDRRKFHGSR